MRNIGPEEERIHEPGSEELDELARRFNEASRDADAIEAVAARILMGPPEDWDGIIRGLDEELGPPPWPHWRERHARGGLHCLHVPGVPDETLEKFADAREVIQECAAAIGLLGSEFGITDVLPEDHVSAGWSGVDFDVIDRHLSIIVMMRDGAIMAGLSEYDDKGVMSEREFASAAQAIDAVREIIRSCSM